MLLREAVKQRRTELLRYAVGCGLTEIATHPGKAGVLIAHRAQILRRVLLLSGAAEVEQQII